MARAPLAVLTLTMTACVGPTSQHPAVTPGDPQISTAERVDGPTIRDGIGDPLAQVT
jgi:hypothetical protein